MTPAYAAPDSLQGALELLRQHGEEARPLAGGQSLVILLRQGLVAPSLLVDLKRIDALRAIETDEDGLVLGATATYRRVSADPVVRDGWPLLADALGRIGSIHIRNRGTVGGSLAQADPVGDATVALLALDAQIDVASVTGQESMAVDGFERAAYETVLEPDQLIVRIRAPRLPPSSSTAYARFSGREGEFPIAQVAVRLTWDGETVSDARIAAGGIGEVPGRLGSSERELVRTGADSAASARAAEAARDSIDPIGDVRGGAEWRRDVVVAIVRRAVDRAVSTRPGRSDQPA